MALPVVAKANTYAKCMLDCRNAGFVGELNERLMGAHKSIVYGFDAGESDSQLGLCAVFLLSMGGPCIALGSSSLYARMGEHKRMFMAASLTETDAGRSSSGSNASSAAGGGLLAFASRALLVLEGCSSVDEVAAVRRRAPASCIVLVRGVPQGALVNEAVAAAALHDCIFELEVAAVSETEFRLLVTYLRGTGTAVIITGCTILAPPAAERERVAATGQEEQEGTAKGAAFPVGLRKMPCCR